MKTSSTPPKVPVDKARAWACMVSNLLVLPGLGSVMGGRKSGWIQATMALGGVAISLGAMIKVGAYWFKTEQLPNNIMLYVWMLGGLLFFLIAWIWSLVTSLLMLRKASEKPG